MQTAQEGRMRSVNFKMEKDPLAHKSKGLNTEINNNMLRTDQVQVQTWVRGKQLVH